MIIVRTPFRISFFGGGTDYPQWYLKHGGAVLATTINLYCYTQIRERLLYPPKFRCVYRKSEEADQISEIKHTLIREVLGHFPVMEGLEIHHDADLPTGTGIGSSSAFAVGLVHALSVKYGLSTEPGALAQLATLIEQERCDTVVGDQDQLMAAYGGLRFIEFNADGSHYTEPIIGAKRKTEIEQHLLLVYLDQRRNASTVASTYDFTNPALELIRRLVDRARDLLRSSESIEGFGELLHESWSLKQQLSERISNNHYSSLYATARKHGAIGGKLIGAGGGGFMLLFAPPDKHETIYRALHGYQILKPGLSYSGSRIIYQA